MRNRRWLLLWFAAHAMVVLAACATPENRYAVLSFFFDGVPPPGGAPAATRAGPSPDAPAVADLGPAPTRFFPHTPYRENRCGGCHEADSGQLVREIKDGLCLTCHLRIVEEKKFVHGPVAVGDCALCHHYHGSPHPNLLLTDPVQTCLQCHDRSDLSPGDHHARMESCSTCHDPHGGENRFFIKRSGT